MATLFICLADLPKGVKSQSLVRIRLEEFFAQVVKAHGAFGKANVGWWTGGTPMLGPHDLLVYFVWGPHQSVVGPGIKPNERISFETNGTTIFEAASGLTGSEVYLRGIEGDPEQLARVAFHELMHNVTHMESNRLHALQQWKNEPVCLGRTRVMPDTRLCKGDIRLMADFLTRIRRVQWTGGFALFNDPLRGL